MTQYIQAPGIAASWSGIGVAATNIIQGQKYWQGLVYLACLQICLTKFKLIKVELTKMSKS